MSGMVMVSQMRHHWFCRTNLRSPDSATIRRAGCAITITEAYDSYHTKDTQCFIRQLS